MRTGPTGSAIRPRRASPEVCVRVTAPRSFAGPRTEATEDRQRRKDGALEAQEAEVRQPYVVPRRRLVFAVWLTVLALPILVIDNIPRTEARATPVKVEAARASSTTATTTTLAPSTTETQDETSTSEAPSTSTSSPHTVTTA